MEKNIKLVMDDEMVKKMIQKDVKETLNWDIDLKDIKKTIFGNWEIVVK